jgi:hypothetical protein
MQFSWPGDGFGVERGLFDFGDGKTEEKVEGNVKVDGTTTSAASIDSSGLLGASI